MSLAKSHQAEGYHSLTPYLSVRGAAKAIEFYKKVFNASVMVRMDGKNGTVAHAELGIGDSVVMLADEAPSMGALSPESIGGTAVGLMLYVKDVDAVFKKAITEGSKSDRDVADQFYGDRNGTIIDPFGHKWTISTHKEDVSPEEMKARMAKMGC